MEPDDRAALLERIAELEAERDRLRHNVWCLRTVLETIRGHAGFALDSAPVFAAAEPLKHMGEVTFPDEPFVFGRGG